MRKIIFIAIVTLCFQISRLSTGAQTASITCPGNVTVSASATTCSSVVNNIDPVVSPAGATVHYSVSFPNNELESSVGSLSGRSFPVGTTTVTYSLADYPGISCSFTIEVEDHDPPVITCPANLTVGCEKDVPPAYLAQISATDACTPSGFIVIKALPEIRSATCPNRVTITRSWTATDLAGNSSTCSQIITVYDETPPSFDQGAPISPLNVTCPSEVPPGYADAYTAKDECALEYESDEVLVVFKEVKSDSICPTKYTLTRTWTAEDGCGNKSVYTQVIHVGDNAGPVFEDPIPDQIITVSSASEIPDAPEVKASDNCSGGTATVTLNEVKSDVECANKFKLTRTWTASDACGNTSSVSQVIEVNDTEPPVFNGSDPLSINVSCEKDIPAAVDQTATDNSGNATVSFSEMKSNVQCANRYTLTRKWIATDECGNSSIRTQVINVYDNEPPVITSVTADPVVLWPPNHKMKEVTINYTAMDNCGVTSELTVSSSDPVNGGSDGDQAPDWEIVDAHHVRLRAEKSNNGQARIYTIGIHITDGCNAGLDTSVTVVVAHNIVSPQTGNPYKIGSTVSLNGTFWDKGGNTHTAKWLLDGNVATNGSVSEPSGNQNGKVAGSYKFNSAGVFKLQMNVTDQNGITSYANTNNDLDAIVVIYDPNGGNAYGGGWFESPAGALVSNPLAEGKTSYGFSINYGNAAKPKGETQFEFKVGSFEFNALNFDYLSIQGARGQFKGTGKIIGGQSGIGFIMTIKDGALDGSGLDKIRMKIYNKNTGYIYYDNQPGAGDAEDPVTVVGSNSTVVIQNPPTVNAMAMSREAMELENSENSLSNLQVMAYPNPAKEFSIDIRTENVQLPLHVRIYDQLGRLLERKDNLTGTGFTMKWGAIARPGVYYLRVVQGRQHKEIKLVKLSD